MSYQSMSFSLTGQIPGLPFPLAQSMITEALGRIYDSLIWSFQFKENGWFTPGLQFASANQSAGTITTAQFSNQIVGDATAAAAWLAYQNAGTLPLLTAFQIRSPYYSLYNIIAFDGVNTFTIDRPWMEPAGAGQAYMVYQSYFAAPTAITDFKRFLEIRDTTNNAPLDFWTYNRVDLSVIDPQRTVFNQPAFVAPYEVDARVGSPTLGNMLWELWGHPLSQLPYTYSYLRRGPLLVNPNDTVPAPLTDELVMWRAKEVAYPWAESQKGNGVARGAGADFQFLTQNASAEYAKELKIIADRDRDLVQAYFHRFVRGAAVGAWGMPYATVNGQLNVGR